MTKEEIQHKLKTDIKWMERAIIRLHDRQTQSEQMVKETQEHNGVGFNSSDSRYLSWVAEYLKKGGHIDKPQHIEKCGRMLPKYWKQIQSMIKNH